ncbi:MAG: hypothetical protein NVS3B18_09480 [Candidatus Dormibacteria bacterium]
MATAVGMRRPLRTHEQPHLIALGRLLGTVRRASGLTQPQLALYAGLSRVQVARIETASTRTRRSTLVRMASALVVHNPGLGSVDRLVDDLVATAGPALAEESQYAERVARRRALRVEAKWRADEHADELGLLRYLHERERSEWWFWRSQQEKDDMRAEAWRDFDARRAEMRGDYARVQKITRA